MNVKEALNFGKDILNQISDTKEIDAELILSHVLKQPRAFLFAHYDYELTKEEEKHFKELVQKRAENQPIAYILNEKYFWSFKLYVNEHTLIPRPETEMLVETALDLCKAEIAKVLDLGTGSGAIALAIAKERPGWKVIGVDKSEAAINVALKNKQFLNLPNVEFFLSDWFTNIDDKEFDIIVSNPPYIDIYEKNIMDKEVFHEPETALFSCDHGLHDIKLIIKHSKDFLKKNGMILLEHGFTQKSEIEEYLKNNGFHEIQSFKDLQGHYRITCAIFRKKNC